MTMNPRAALALLRLHGASRLVDSLRAFSDSPVQSIATRSSCEIVYEVVVGELGSSWDPKPQRIWSRVVPFGETDATILGGAAFSEAESVQRDVVEAAWGLLSSDPQEIDQILAQDAEAAVAPLVDGASNQSAEAGPAERASAPPPEATPSPVGPMIATLRRHGAHDLETALREFPRGPVRSSTVYALGDVFCEVTVGDGNRQGGWFRQVSSTAPDLAETARIRDEVARAALALLARRPDGRVPPATLMDSSLGSPVVDVESVSDTLPPPPLSWEDFCRLPQGSSIEFYQRETLRWLPALVAARGRGGSVSHREDLLIAVDVRTGAGVARQWLDWESGRDLLRHPRPTRDRLRYVHLRGQHHILLSGDPAGESEDELVTARFRDDEYVLVLDRWLRIPGGRWMRMTRRTLDLTLAEARMLFLAMDRQPIARDARGGRS